MKLLFTWLLGVPTLVLAMVVARAMTPQGLQVAEQRVVSACPGQLDFDHVGSVVTKDAYGIACNHGAVH
jgi:hypothetical protein